MANTTGKKFGGRKKGTPNAVTKELRERVKMFLDESHEEFLTRVSQLGDKDYVDTVIKLMEFAIPKLARTEISGIEQQEIKLPKFSWKEGTENP